MPGGDSKCTSARVYEAGHHGGSALMTYHGGKILSTAITKSIFWGTSWAAYTGDKITGLDTWFLGFNGSNYAKTSDEYTGSNGQVGPLAAAHRPFSPKFAT